MGRESWVGVPDDVAKEERVCTGLYLKPPLLGMKVVATSSSGAGKREPDELSLAESARA